MNFRKEPAIDSGARMPAAPVPAGSDSSQGTARVSAAMQDLGVPRDAHSEVLSCPSSGSRVPLTPSSTPECPKEPLCGGRDFLSAPAMRDQPPALMGTRSGDTNQEINPPSSCLHPHLLRFVLTSALPITAALLRAPRGRRGRRRGLPRAARTKPGERQGRVARAF